MIRWNRGCRTHRGSGASLEPALVDAIWTFMCRHVQRDRAEFEETLRSCQSITVLTDRDTGRVEGLGAAWLVDTGAASAGAASAEAARAEATAVFVQWMHLSRRLRGSLWPVLFLTGLLLRAYVRRPFRVPYIVFGAATWAPYLAFSRFVVEGAPFRNTGKASVSAEVAASVFRQIHPKRWDEATQTIKGRGTWAYRAGVAATATEAPADPDIQHYIALNPGQADGDCLPVSVPASARNWMAFLSRRVWQRGRPTRPTPPSVIAENRSATAALTAGGSTP